ncbi:Ig-like domain-containing protein [uncultured Shewanella sp.]|uniref:Ig-like domain-containing protein n=1 Tax=uncultured Shewanella sp. TaxID=173975 RepID=UPI00261DFA46|nr:Ig-like domain-containing protein [uncultured Shewanella sp.]
MNYHSKLQSYIFIIIFIMLIGCDRSDKVLLPSSSPQVDEVIELTPFVFRVDSSKGGEISLDFSSNVSGSDSWFIESIDFSDITAEVEIKDKKAFISTESVGFITFDWKIINEGITYSSTGLLAIDNRPETNSRPDTRPVTLTITTEESLVFDLSNYVSDDDGDKLVIGPFLQTADRFKIQDFLVEYIPGEFKGNDIAFYGVTDGKGGISIGEISIIVRDLTIENTPPTARNITRTMEEGGAIVFDVKELLNENFITDENGDDIVFVRLLGDSGRATLTTNTNILYTPSSFVGNDSFVYVISDEQGGLAQAEINITVTPTFIPEALSVKPIVLSLLKEESTNLNVSSAVNSGLSWTLDSVAATGNGVKVGALTSTTVELTALETGVERLNFSVSTSADSKTSEIIVAVTELGNTAPLAQDIVSNTDNVTAVNINLAGKYSDPDGDSVTVNSLIQESSRFSIVGDVVSYTPSGFIGVDSAVYVVEDSRGGYALGLLLVNVTDANPPVPNIAPTASDYAASTNSLTPISINLTALGLISDPENSPLTVTIYGGEGRATLAQDIITYTPNGFIGSEELVYQVTDNANLSDFGTLTFTVADGAPNLSPVATDYDVTIDQEDSLVIDISKLILDGLISDPDGDSLVFDSIGGTSGRAVLTSNTAITYNAGSFSGTDSFVYVLSDGNGGLAQAEITITVIPTFIPEALSVKPIVLSLLKEESTNLNVSSAVNSGLSWTLDSVAATGNGVKVGALTSSTVELTALEAGVERLNFSVSTSGDSKTSEIIVAVTELGNTAPLAQDIVSNTDNVTAVNINLAGKFSDPDGDSVTVNRLIQESSRFSIVGDVVSYTPSGFIGVDSAVYVVEDSRGGYALGLLLVNVTDANPPVPNIAPTASDYAASTDSLTPISINLTALGLISDPENSPLTVIIYGGEGRATLAQDIITYTPNGFIGSEELVYQVTDNANLSDFGTLTLTVADGAPNLSPVATDYDVTIDQEDSLVIDISKLILDGLISDPDGDSLVFDSIGGTSGRAVLTSNTAITYNAGSFSGTDSFVYVLSDGNGGLAQAEITITVIPTFIPEALSVKPIVLSLLKEESTNLNVSSAVNSGLSWTLDSVVATGNGVKVGALTSSTVELTALEAGVERLNFSVSTSGDSKTSEIIVAVTELGNTAPLAQDIVSNTDNVTAVNINLAGKYSDPDGDSVAVNSLIQESSRFSIVGDVVSYTPSGFIGVDSAVYVVEDSRGGYALGLLLVNVTDANPPVPNIAPTAFDYAASTDSLTPISINLTALGLISDPENSPLTVTIYGGEGRATLSQDIITYTPNGFIGSEEVVYQVSDFDGATAIATISFAVSDASPNTPPIASPVTINLSVQDINTQPVRTIDLSSFVSDLEGDIITVDMIYASVNPISIDGGLILSYTATFDVVSDKFTYVITDGEGGVSQNVVTVNIINEAPIANAAVANIDPFDSSNNSIDINLADYTSDLDGDTLSLVDIGTVLPPATLSRNGLILTYKPNGEVRNEAISYTVSDNLYSASNIINISSASAGGLITGPLTYPDILMDSGMQTIDLSSVVSNSSGRPVVIKDVFGARLGDTNIIPNTLTFSYEPLDVNYGEDIFYYTVTDNEGHEKLGQIIVNILEPSSPVISDVVLSYGEELVANVSCSACEIANTTYQFEVEGLPVTAHNPVNSYFLNSEEQVGVTVTVRNKYCTITASNACKSQRAKVVAELDYVKSIFPLQGGFLAVKSNGSVVGWGSDFESQWYPKEELKNLKQLLSSGLVSRTYVALKQDGSIVNWGLRNIDSSSVQELLVDIESLTLSFGDSIGALKSDGTVVTWGSAFSGGDSSSVSSQLVGVTKLISNLGVMAALKSDGNVVTWGTFAFGGLSTAVQSQLVGVTKLNNHFSAIRDDGVLINWGNGNNSSAVQSELINIIDSVSTKGNTAFAALKADGGVVTWGAGLPADSSAVQSQLVNVKEIVGTDLAFAALKVDGSVVTWGDPVNGGDSSSVQSSLQNVVKLYSSNKDFVALKQDGTIVSWGEVTSSFPAPPLLTDVKSIYASNDAFAVLTADKHVVVWGREENGGDSSAFASDLEPKLSILFKDLAFN